MVLEVESISIMVHIDTGTRVAAVVIIYDVLSGVVGSFWSLTANLGFLDEPSSGGNFSLLNFLKKVRRLLK